MMLIPCTTLTGSRPKTTAMLLRLTELREAEQALQARHNQLNQVNDELSSLARVADRLVVLVVSAGIIDLFKMFTTIFTEGVVHS